MRITVLTVPDCPNAPLMRERIAAALDGRPAQVEGEVEVEVVEVTEDAEAARRGMTGSPTMLLDGVDPFAAEGAPASLSCRLYRDDEGRLEGAPGITALRRALATAEVSRAGADADAGAGTECCEPDALDAIGRAGRGRRAPAERGLRAVHQAVLRHFAATGRAPGTAGLEPVAAAAGRAAGEVLAELGREDFLHLDRAGRIRAAYPFSAVETRHRVRLAGGVETWSMCAIDALGVSAMLGQDVTVSSSDPLDGRPVTVTFVGGTARWEPAEAVVFIGRREGAGPAALVCCEALNFFAGRASAERWARAHPEVKGEIIAQDRAVEIGVRTFGPLLAG
ncbi:alkylmercury lyase family protein [Streptomyces sp. YIM 98790]|uniref:alkylmercury lyase family protein n=1 Tax=Streptomyces sp. YIM 98790 TaxID=2689077 RepID=UPI00140A5187|nr:alkylmercury lyase family protein [Streptomyces sp. YIM 98790]